MVFECFIVVMSYVGLELILEKIVLEFERFCNMFKDDGGILGNVIQLKIIVDIIQQLEVVQRNIRIFENLYKK